MDVNAQSTKAPVVIAIVGFPGSGKSYLLRTMKRDDPALFVADDFLKDSGTAMCVDSRYLGSLVTAIKDGHRAAIADIFFTDTQKRREFEALIQEKIPKATIDWMYFENDPIQCEANLRALAEGQHVEHRIAGIVRFKVGYEIPEGSRTIPVYRPSA